METESHSYFFSKHAQSSIKGDMEEPPSGYQDPLAPGYVSKPPQPLGPFLSLLSQKYKAKFNSSSVLWIKIKTKAGEVGVDGGGSEQSHLKSELKRWDKRKGACG